MSATVTLVSKGATSDEGHKIETGDSIKVKQVLDDATVEAVRDMGYSPDYKLENIKLFLMFLSCLFAMTAQFYPIPFPTSRPLLGVCCAAYGLLSLVLQGIITYVDQDTILVTKADSSTGKGEIRVRTNFPRFQEDFTLTVQKLSYVEPSTPPAFSKETDPKVKEQKEKEYRDQKQGDISSVKMYVGRYFTDVGEFAEDRFYSDVRAHIARFEKGNAPREYAMTFKSD